MNDIIEVTSLHQTRSDLSAILKLSKDQYCLLETGEIKDYNHTENRGQNIAGLKKSFKKIRDLINNNFTGAGNELHITLTYADNMRDSKRLYDDFKAFWKRFKRRYGNDFEYLTVVEPQGRGAWHCHVLIKSRFPDDLFINSKELAKIWGNGFIKIKSLKGVDNIGAYLSAYLSDIELTVENVKEIGAVNIHDIKEITDEKGQTKSYIKGGRMHFYPPGMNLYRHTKGIEFPVNEKMEYGELKKIIGDASPNYTLTVQIVGQTIEGKEKIYNTITYENYNMKRQGNKKQESNDMNYSPCLKQQAL